MCVREVFSNVNTLILKGLMKVCAFSISLRQHLVGKDPKQPDLRKPSYSE